MKTKRWLAIILALCIAGLLTAGVVQAQNIVTTNPTQITIAGSRGDVETRTLLLQSAAAITNVQVVVMDLPGVDGATVLPASAIKTSINTNTVTANEMITLSVTVDMANVVSGEFQGNLFVNYHDGQLTVPLTVRVKDTWYLPLLLLVAGIMLAMGTSYYRAQGKPRDELLVRAGQLQAQMKKDAELAEPFRAAIDTAVVDTETALQTQKWEDAQTALDKAETYWNRWRRHRRDWLAQLAYYRDLLTQLNQTDPQNNVPYIQSIKRTIMDVERTIADVETPETWRPKLEERSEQLNRYHRLKALIDTVGQQANDLAPTEAATWRREAGAWQDQLDQLEPTDQAAYQTLKQQVVDGAARLAEAKTADVNEVMRSDGAKGLFTAVFATPGLLGAAPTLLDTGDEGQVAAANWKLRIFAVTTYTIAITFLAGAGFAELYIARPTFGANPWGDYFALLVWGFGVEASRSAVVDMIRGWGVQ